MNKYSTECALITSHFVAESDTQNGKMYAAVCTFGFSSNLKKSLCINTVAHSFQIKITHTCILIVIQVKSMWKPQWINWMGQIALKFRFNKSLLICQKADGHFFLFFFFFYFNFFSAAAAALPCKYGDDLCTIQKCAYCDRYLVDNEYQPIHACVMNVRVHLHENDERAREREEKKIHFEFRLCHNKWWLYIYLYGFT